MKSRRTLVTLAVAFLVLAAVLACDLVDLAFTQPDSSSITPTGSDTPSTEAPPSGTPSSETPSSETPALLPPALTALQPTSAAAIRQTISPSSPFTRTPTIAPFKPTGPPTYSALLFSSAFDEKALVALKPAIVFPYGVKIIYASWTYGGVTPNTRFEFAWYRDGAVVESKSDRFANPSGKSFQFLLYGAYPTTPLESGNYKFVVKVAGATVLSDDFVIQPPTNPGTNTLTIFFTIQNGSPTGYVVDKQGIKHSPSGTLTISDFYVSIGDRVLLQTDQSHFSLMFDCGTTPELYTPCDFSADASTKLPAEIRKNRNGTAYLNVSRADNWAGLRPDFEPQRYPAEPALHVVLGD